jgi:hypothetical protein
LPADFPQEVIRRLLVAAAGLPGACGEMDRSKQFSVNGSFFIPFFQMQTLSLINLLVVTVRNAWFNFRACKKRS